MTVDTTPALFDEAPQSAVVQGVSTRSFAAQVWVFAEREIARIGRDLATTLQTILYPVLNLVMFEVILGKTVTTVNQRYGDGRPAIYAYVALVSVVASMGGALSTGFRLQSETKSGLISRFCTMPVASSADLLGRILAGTAQSLITVIFVIAGGMVWGFEFKGSIFTMIAFVLLPALFGTGFSMMIVAFSAWIRSSRVLEIATLIQLVLMFFSSGFVPVFAYPGVLRTIVGNQPISVAVDALIDLSWHGQFTFGIVKMGLWIVILFAVFLPIAARGYRKCAEVGGTD